MLLFIALEAVAVTVLIHGNLQHKAQLAAVSNAVSGGIYNQIANVRSYFGLRGENRRLQEQNAELRSLLSNAGYAGSVDEISDSLLPFRMYEFTPARVVNNRISKRENYLTIDLGRVDGMEKDMALISEDGIVGYILYCSEHYSKAISILNIKEFRTSGMIKGRDFFGSIYWDGLSHREVILDEMPKYAEITPGDTVVTAPFSYIFPPDQPIGTVKSYELVNGTYYRVRVELFADMARLRNVYAVRYLDQQERRLLENAESEMELSPESMNANTGRR